MEIKHIKHRQSMCEIRMDAAIKFMADQLVDEISRETVAKMMENIREETIRLMAVPSNMFNPDWVDDNFKK